MDARPALRHAPEAYDVVVIGAGVIGLAIARRLARHGRSVAVLERDSRGAVASRAAAGMLAPQAETREPDSFFELALEAREGFAAFAWELEAETGHALDYRREGLLAFAADDESESDLARRAEWQRAAGLEVEELTRGEARERWPDLELPPAVPANEARRFGEGRLFYFPSEAQVDGGRLVDALLAACAAAGVDVRPGSEATGFIVHGDRVTGVRCSDGALACDMAVNAAGAWAGRVAAWVGEALPVEPVRGEMLAFATALRPPRPIVMSGEAYCLLRGTGELLVGATVERVGYDASTTPEGQAWLQASAAALVPALAGRQPSAHWAGLRPGAPDGLPVLGFSGEVQGLYHATGHFRNGILLAAVSAELACAALEGDVGLAAGAPFAPTRFAARATGSE